MTDNLCRNCGQPGHYIRECPDLLDGGPVDADAPWCGGCDQRTRHLTDADGRERRCPRCWLPRMAARGHPDARLGLPLPQTWGMDAATKLRARYLRETDYGRRSASPELEAEMQARGMVTHRGAEGVRGQMPEPEPVRVSVEPGAEDDLGHLHGEALAAAQLAEARRGRLPEQWPARPEPEPAEPSPNGHRAPVEPVEGEGEFPF